MAAAPPHLEVPAGASSLDAGVDAPLAFRLMLLLLPDHVRIAKTLWETWKFVQQVGIFDKSNGAAETGDTQFQPDVFMLNSWLKCVELAGTMQNILLVLILFVLVYIARQITLQGRLALYCALLSASRLTWSDGVSLRRKAARSSASGPVQLLPP